MDVLVPSVAGGVLNAAGLFLLVIAIGLLYHHGRYVPIWLPDLGLLGAFIIHALWSRSSVSLAVLLSAVICCAIAMLIHVLLIGPLLRNQDTLGPLLIGVGLSQVFQAITGIYGSGMSQHYPENFLSKQSFVGTLGVSIYQVDYAFVGCALATTVGLGYLLRYTHLGLHTRAVFANPAFAKSLGIRVSAVNCIVLCFAAVLALAATTMRGIRFDLQPNMMLYPGLVAISACIVAGQGRIGMSLLVVLGDGSSDESCRCISDDSAISKGGPFCRVDFGVDS